MKKIFIILFAFLTAFNIGISYAAINTSKGALDHEQLMFVKRLQTCSPAKYEPTGEEVLGRTRDGKCGYIFDEDENSKKVTYYCIIPMQVALGYTSTILDANDYLSTYPEIAQERVTQNAEIKKIMFDYCKKIQR